MRHAPALLLSSLLCFTPAAVTAADAPARAGEPTPLQVDFEIAEVAKDGTRRAVTLSLSLPDRGGRGGPTDAELLTRLALGERGEAYYYKAEVQPEATPAGTRYFIDLRRASHPDLQHPDLRIEVARVLRPGAAVQLGRVLRPDGTALVVTATAR
jgi:hypothetical protein